MTETSYLLFDIYDGQEGKCEEKRFLMLYNNVENYCGVLEVF